MESKRVVVGIDLGTTNTCVAVYQNGEPVAVRNEYNKTITPSVVAFADEGILVGEDAKTHAFEDSRIFGIKRLMGHDFDDKVIQENLAYCPFQVENVNGKPLVKVEFRGEDRRFHPEEISALILEKIKDITEKFLPDKIIKDAVITVPAYFDNNQKAATKAAGKIAGLNVLKLIDEPTAAAIAYRLDKEGDGKKTILVFDLGGGTFDVSILTMEHGSFKVLAKGGDTHLGGEDFDNRMVDYFAKKIQKDCKKDIKGDRRALRRLRDACIKIKIDLSTNLEAKSNELANLIGDHDFTPRLTRSEFEKINKDLFNKTSDIVKKNA